MAEKRKDSNGRILRTGESQRPNGTYMFRYTTPSGKKKWCYAPTLKELRELEKEIASAEIDGIDLSAPYSTVLDLVDCYLKSHTAVRQQTAEGYQHIRNRISREAFSGCKISDVKQSDAKAFFVHMNKKGLCYRTLLNFQALLRPAFEMAVQDNYIRVNPIAFKLSSVIKNEQKKKFALTQEQIDSFLSFLKADTVGAKYYDEFVILIETGLRISELCGLTIDSVDLENRRIRVVQQLIGTSHDKLRVDVPKTKTGVRVVPLTTMAYEAFQRVLERRAKKPCTMEIDGQTGFLFVKGDGVPMVSDSFRASLKRLVNKYNKSHETPLPNITPHTLRHTFVSRLYEKGIDVKCLQMVVGHSNVQTTLNIYTHIDYDRVEQEFHKVTADDT